MAKFTPGELEVMRILWSHGELKPAEIQRRFSREIRNNALRSYLTILLEKGHVIRQRKGKAYYYRAKTRLESTFRLMFDELVRSCFDGSTEALLCHLIKQEELSEDDLLELKRMAEEETPSETLE